MTVGWRFIRHTFALLVGVAGPAAAQAAVSGKATVLVFSQQDEGSRPYEARMLVTPQYLRLDNGSDRGGFILLNRATRTVYSVSRSDHTILVIRPQKIHFPRPAGFRQRVVRDKGSYPEIAGKKVVHYTFLTDGKRCFDVYAAAGLLPDAVAALREYQQVLVGEQAVTEARTPPSVRSVCDLSRYIFRPARYLRYGFPVRQTDNSGATRELLSYHRAVPVAPGLFTLPPHYRRYSIAQSSGGGP